MFVDGMDRGVAPSLAATANACCKPSPEKHLGTRAQTLEFLWLFAEIQLLLGVNLDSKFPVTLRAQ